MILKYHYKYIIINVIVVNFNSYYYNYLFTILITVAAIIAISHALTYFE